MNKDDACSQNPLQQQAVDQVARSVAFAGSVVKSSQDKPKQVNSYSLCRTSCTKANELGFSNIGLCYWTCTKANELGFSNIGLCYWTCTKANELGFSNIGLCYWKLSYWRDSIYVTGDPLSLRSFHAVRRSHQLLVLEPTAEIDIHPDASFIITTVPFITYRRPPPPE